MHTGQLHPRDPSGCFPTTLRRRLDFSLTKAPSLEHKLKFLDKTWLGWSKNEIGLSLLMFQVFTSGPAPRSPTTSTNSLMEFASLLLEELQSIQNSCDVAWEDEGNCKDVLHVTQNCPENLTWFDLLRGHEVYVCCLWFFYGAHPCNGKSKHLAGRTT